MAQWQHGGGFSVDGSVRIEAEDRAGRERRLRYCARPPLALDWLRELDPERLVYDPPKRGPGGSALLLLTPLELLDRLRERDRPPPAAHDAGWARAGARQARAPRRSPSARAPLADTRQTSPRGPPSPRGDP